MKKNLLLTIVFSIFFITSTYAAGSSGNSDNKSVYERGYYIIKKAKKLEKKGISKFVLKQIGEPLAKSLLLTNWKVY